MMLGGNLSKSATEGVILRSVLKQVIKTSLAASTWNVLWLQANEFREAERLMTVGHGGESRVLQCVCKGGLTSFGSSSGWGTVLIYQRPCFLRRLWGVFLLYSYYNKRGIWSTEKGYNLSIITQLANSRACLWKLGSLDWAHLLWCCSWTCLFLSWSPKSIVLVTSVAWLWWASL